MPIREVIISKHIAHNRDEAAEVARNAGFEVDKMNETKNTYRFVQGRGPVVGPGFITEISPGVTTITGESGE